jgi:hypothetical protein
MARCTSWIVLCFVLAAMTACAGPRAGRSCAPACDPCTAQTPPPPCDRPPEAKPGEAWCRVWEPAIQKTVTERVLVCPGRCETVHVPAEYGTRPKLVCVAPAKVRESVRPGVWSHEAKDVMVRPPHEVYRKVKCCDGAHLAPGEKQGDCWVKESCPPVFRKESHAVCVAPPKRVVEYTPAKYKLREERFVLHPARCEVQRTAPRYEERTRTVCVRPGRWVWRHNTACEVPETKLPALETNMVDHNEDGTEQGVFQQGSIVRYDLSVRSDVGNEAFPMLKVLFTLPKQLEFVSGGGDGVTVTGSGQAAKSSSFKLSVDQEVKIHVLARVVSVPPTSFVQTTASVQSEDGEELAVETESTTLESKGGQ